MVLGLVLTKLPELEDASVLLSEYVRQLQRFHKAGSFSGRGFGQLLAISPQCRFVRNNTSRVVGTEDRMWKKFMLRDVTRNFCSDVV